MKQKMIKALPVLVIALGALGLAACNGTAGNQDSPPLSIYSQQTTVANQGSLAQATETQQPDSVTSGESAQLDLSAFDAFPQWWRDLRTEDEKQTMLELLTPEQLEQLREQAEEWGEEGPPMTEGSQQAFVVPGAGGGSGSRIWTMTEDGLVEVGVDEIDLEDE